VAGPGGLAAGAAATAADGPWATVGPRITGVTVPNRHRDTTTLDPPGMLDDRPLVGLAIVDHP
jgi:hypothetical protein